MTGNAEVILVRGDGALILQHRDDKPGIANPGLVTTFGGHIEPGETPEQAALREINEETNLELTVDDLVFYRKYQKTMAEHGEDWDVYFYVAQNIDDSHLEVYEGQGFVIAHSLDQVRATKRQYCCKRCWDTTLVIVIYVPRII